MGRGMSFKRYVHLKGILIVIVKIVMAIERNKQGMKTMTSEIELITQSPNNVFLKT